MTPRDKLSTLGIFTIGLVAFYPDPEYGGFFGLLVALWVAVIAEMVLTMVVTTIVHAAVPARFRRKPPGEHVPSRPRYEELGSSHHEKRMRHPRSSEQKEEDPNQHVPSSCHLVH